MNVVVDDRTMKLNTEWKVVLEQDADTGEWAAWCPTLPGCASAGQTEAEALENIREAIELYLEPTVESIEKR